MAAYGALVSLAQTVENFIHSQKVRDEETRNVVSFHEKIQTVLTEGSSAAMDSAYMSRLAFVSQDLENYIQDNQLWCDYDLIASLHEKVILLQEVFDKFPQKVPFCEVFISRFAYDVETLIESLSDAFRTNEEDLFIIKQFIGLSDQVLSSMENVVDAGDSFSVIRTNLRSGNEIHEIHGKERLFGFDHQLEEIENHLLSHVKEIQILPMVGMGGIGKTSLARATFNLPTIVRSFEIRRWVNVSQEFSAKAILLAILGDESSDGMNTSIIDLRDRINKFLYHKRYLIVIDDIWDLDAWDEVRILLREDENRSRVVFTTRHENLTRYVKSSGFIHHMQFMNQETSWSLLKYRVFGEEPCPPELTEIGQRIAKGCGGLPLAIVVVAGILSNINLDCDSWERIAKDVNEAIETNDDHFLETLALSYQHLPHRLRPCFLYLSGFPKDRSISVSKLIKLWVAEGFLKKSEDMEKTAYDFFQELVNRNLVMANVKGYGGRIRMCKMHDLLRDLCIRKAQDEAFFQLKHTLFEDVTYKYRATFCPDAPFILYVRKHNLLHLRSALCFWNNSNLLSLLADSKWLRVLDASQITCEKFPSQLLKSSRLRLLTLSWNPEVIFRVPYDTHALENLETLIIRCHLSSLKDIKCLIMSSEIWRLSKLRHLCLYPMSFLPDPPSGIFSPLVNLKTLTRIRNLRFTDEMVRMIPNVRKLYVLYSIDSTKDALSDFAFHNLSHLRHLEYLRFLFTNIEYDLEWCKKYPVMKSLILPASLKVLKLQVSTPAATWEDMTRLTGSLPNLQVLKLAYAFYGDVWETGEEDYQNLKLLEICISDLKSWRSESSNPFPSLQHLVLVACPSLTEFPDGIEHTPNLESITVDDRQEATVNWATQIEEEQHDMGNETFQVIVLKCAELMEDKETESREAKLFKFLTIIDGDIDKFRLISIMHENDAGVDMADYIYQNIHMLNSDATQVKQWRYLRLKQK